MSGVTLKDIRKSYGAFEVIKGVDLDIRSKEFVVFVGPSGCGKSTLLRMIAGLEEITGGELKIGDTVMNDVDASRRGIAMVFQSYALYPHMTVEENMGFALKYAGVKKDEIKRQVGEAARILELDKLMDRRPKDLSGGQRQRVAIGRAIVRHPDVFLFDEPLSNLDAELRVQMRIEIARLHSELQSTIIYVTHDQVEAMTLADKIVVLRDGRIEQVGTPLDLYDDPDNIFVAGFIGSPRMNFLPAIVQNGRLVFDEHDGQSVAPPPLATKLSDGMEVTVGLRPEHFTKEGEGVLELTVEIVENLGGETYAYARQGQSGVLTIATGGARNLHKGDTLRATYDPGDALLFSRDGARLR
ncbi:ABC transporter ATP-binding protein [Pelagovum pacificum]|uniref:sn-glycerol-3-phosphate ABC transporter ATP-binding protein UgpC n=1 Tax=Pelagovum pacificum TaxID=2588711 RepID=A0A5C5GE68_9RHOB|nr:sn-glycerol-3-phosphate ABC transporter ATP-binding protein UgpC [Pelagovum pacificum]QQA43860.1 sn-glycerol-3-phosphate ABC transporter ATP-binding protein UgpC [Pelagovum pacificum]TNY33008.1 sn-glycerol-3-phosphate ABC transporter ATP-binding protein UgpC [Pelagovum pacificum]